MVEICEYDALEWDGMQLGRFDLLDYWPEVLEKSGNLFLLDALQRTEQLYYYTLFAQH